MNCIGSNNNNNIPLTAAIAISPSWDFLNKSYLFECYSKYLLIHGLRNYLKKHQKYLESHPDCKIKIKEAINAKNVYEFDYYAVVPVFNYDNVEHYYQKSSAINVSHNINIPTLAISSEDDPICYSAGCPDKPSQLGNGLVVVKTMVGGHLGFMSGVMLNTTAWHDNVALEWCNAFL